MSKKVFFGAVVASLVLLFAGAGLSFGETFQLNLKEGWNLISIPLVPQDNSVEAVFDSLAGKYKSVWTWRWEEDSKGKIFTNAVYYPADPGRGTLATIETGQGYWVEMAEEGILEIEGSPPADPAVDLQTGWNLVGFNSREELWSWQALQSIQGKIRSAWVWELKDGKWEAMEIANSFTSSMKPGQGYAIYANEPCRWLVSASTPPPVVNDQLVKLLSAQLQPNRTWKYRLGLWKSAISGSKTAPFVTGDFNQWQTQSIADADGDMYYEVEIFTYNKEMRLTYGGNRAANSWADITKSKFYDFSSNSLVVGFCNGALYLKGAAPFGPKPGSQGDDYVRFSLSGSIATVYFNNNKVNGSLASPFHMGTYNNWTAVNQTITDSSGWGRTTFQVWLPDFFRLAYGGSKPANSWADITKSAYYDATTRSICFYVSASGIVSAYHPPAVVEPVKLISAQLLPASYNYPCLWKYRLGLWKGAISGSKAAPFAMGEFGTKWWGEQAISDIDGDMYYELYIYTYNREIRFAYGGNKAASSWADITKSAYYDSVNKSLVIGFCNGAIYKKGAAPFGPKPGSQGDDYVRFSLSGSNLTVYFNNNKVNGWQSPPFHMGSYNNWAPANQTVTDSSGWGRTVIQVSRPEEFWLSYGGNYALRSWADITGSTYYDPASASIHFKVDAAGQIKKPL